MSQLKSLQLQPASYESKVRSGLQLPTFVKVSKPVEAIFVLLTICALFLWSISLKQVDIRRMTDLGLVSVLPASIIIALIILTVSFCLSLRQPERRVPVLLLQLVILIFMLYGITTLVEEAPRFAVVYRHAGYTEYIMRTGSVNPKLDAYFNWPGFFILSAFLTRIVGDHDVLSLAAWAPVFFNLIYLGPLYMIFTSATTDKRLVWLGLWFFYLTNWIGQDYFSPQALNYFLYLVIIAILLKWFQAAPGSIPRLHWRYFGNFSLLAQKLYKWLTVPDSPRTVAQLRQRIALLVSLVLIFILVVFSHPLTPFLVLGSVTTLVVFRCCTLRWLPLLIAAMTCAWIIFMAQAFLAGHSFLVTGSLGQVDQTITANVLNRAAQGSSEHNFISAMRVIMTVVIWGLAFAGGVRRLRRGYRDVAYVLLAVTPFSLILAQSYGGEMLLRIYLFTLPLMVFFAAALFYITPADGRSPWMTLAVTATSVVLLSGFLFTRYGNERMDYMTYAEVNGVHQLYNIAQPNSLLIEGWNGTPWQFQDYEKYSYYSLTDILPDAVRTGDVNSIVQFIEREKHPHAYLIFTRSQKATAELFSRLPPGTLDRLENALLGSKEFKLVYSNPDTQIFTLDRQ